MLTKRQNFLEAIRGGKPDRFPNQFEALEFIWDTPFSRRGLRGELRPGGPPVVSEWGVTMQYPEGTPGPFPMHDEEHIVLKDITKWREQVTFPSLEIDVAEWEECAAKVAQIDRTDKFVSAMVAPGVFDQIHFLMGMEECLISFYTEPEALKEFLRAFTDWKLEYARIQCEYLKPEVVFHHDDFGSQISTFLSPDMFAEFIFPCYKEIYGYYKAHGVDLIIHHSDSYAATLIPHMIDVGIDVFQGCLDTNNIPELIKKYEGKMSFMGGINNGIVDVPGWTDELIGSYVEKMCRDCGTLYYIPCCTAGGPGSSYPGVYDTVTKQIERVSGLMF